MLLKPKGHPQERLDLPHRHPHRSRPTPTTDGSLGPTQERVGWDPWISSPGHLVMSPSLYPWLTGWQSPHSRLGLQPALLGLPASSRLQCRSGAGSTAESPRKPKRCLGAGPT